MAGVMKIKAWVQRIIPKKKKQKKSGRYERNKEHIKQVRQRKRKQAKERIKYKLSYHKRSLIICGSIVLCVLAALSAYGVVRAIGKSRLYDAADNGQPDMQIATEEETVTETERARWKEGWVKYKGEIYEYKEDILTFLIMGIDKNSDEENL